MQENVRDLWRIDESRRREIIDALRRKRNYQNSDGTKKEAMTQEDVAIIASLPQVTVGSHTSNHPILPHCTDQETEDELRTSKEVLEGWTGKPVAHFSYPNGEYSVCAKRLLPKLGYVTGATTEPRLGLTTDDPFEIPRFHVMDDGSFAENLCHMLGFWFRMTAKARGTLLDSAVK
jgi:peptidoglycan/xylan/chitin deacetylase (PgdA/CDA1 family)